MEQTTDVQVLPLEEKIDQDFKMEIVKIIPDTESALQKLKDKYMTIKVTDKNSFRKAEEARKDVKNVRIAGEKVCDSFSKPLEEQKKAWIKKKKDWSALTGEIEEYLEGQTDEWKAAEQKRKDEEAERQENERRQIDKRMVERQQELGKMSVLFADNTFMLGEVRYSYEKVREADDEVYQNEILPAFKTVFDEHEEERRQQEIERQQEQDRQQQEADRLRQEQEQLKKEQEEMKQQRFELRRDRALALGMDKITNAYKYKAVAGALITEHDMMQLSNEDYNNLYHTVSSFIEEAKTIEADRKERERIAKERSDIAKLRAEKLNGIEYKYPFVFFNGQKLFDADELIDMPNAKFDLYYVRHNENLQKEKAEAERKRQEEEEQKRVEAEKDALRKSRLATLKALNCAAMDSHIDFGTLEIGTWEKMLSDAQKAYSDTKHQEWIEQERVKQIQIEEREKERLSELSENKRWKEWVEKKLIPFMADIPAFESKRYVRARAIATDKFEEIITLKPGNF